MSIVRKGDKAGRKMTRRQFLKRSGIWFGTIAATTVFGFEYATAIEPRWLHIRRTTLHLPRLPKAFHGVRIAQFSDTHLGFHYEAEQLAKLIAVIRAENPDIVCFTGDLVDEWIGEDRLRIQQVLSELQAPLGCYAVLGNHDYFGNANEVASLLDEGGFRCLRNEAFPVDKDGESIWIAGVDDMLRGRPDLPRALEPVHPDAFVLLLSHAPDFADTAVAYPVDLQLSGHSHGGQVRLPGIGPLVTVRGARKYPDGLYTLGNGKLTLYTNRGIGVSVKSVRFLCRPELTVFTLIQPT